MADPIRLPNSTSKDLSTAKITRADRQRFEKRQKRQQRKHDMRHTSNREQPGMSVNRDGSDLLGRPAREKKVVKRAVRNRTAGNPDGGQGNVIDICV